MRTRHLFWQVPLLLLLTTPLWWRAAAKRLVPDEKVRYSNILSEKKIIMDDVKLSQRREGKRELIAHADHLESQENQEVFNLKNVTGTFFTDDDIVDISSSEAIYNSLDQVVTLLGDVHLQDSNSFELKTDVMRFLTKFNKIKSAAPLQATSPDWTVTGTSFFYDLDSGNFRVGKRVVCQIKE